jgi:D-galactarolactone cycloisomerase
VAGGETWHTRWGFREPLEIRCVDIAQPDLCGVGGFTEAKRVVDLASVHNVRVVPHVWGTAVHLAAALQFMASMVPNPVRVNPIEPIMEFDRTHNPFRQAIVKTPIEHQGGVVAVPDAPGLGIDIDRAALAEFAPKED